MIHKKVYYGEDAQAGAKGPAFYWAASDQKRRELALVKRSHPDIYESTYQCRPGTRIGSIFLEDDFLYYKAPAGLSLGIIDPDVRKFLSGFQAIVAAWDTAFEANSEANYTVGVVAGLLPCESYHRGEDSITFGECEPHMDVFILDLLREKLTWGDLPREFRRLHRKWNINTHVVEKRGAGISLYQSMPTIGIHVEGVDVKESKSVRAISGNEAGSTQGWFRQHRVRIPYGAKWVTPYKTELKDFTGDNSGFDDQVDATVHLVNYAIRLGSAAFLLPSAWTPETVDDIMEVLPEDQYSSNTTIQSRTIDILNWLQVAEDIDENPFAETCQFCINNSGGLCSIQRRIVSAFDNCIEFEPLELVDG